MAARRLERVDGEHEEKEDKKHEASRTEAFVDRTKVANLVVQNLFVDNGFGFRKDPTGEVVFIQASVVQGAEVLMVGTDAWAQVVSDHARVEGEASSTKGLGTESLENEERRRPMSATRAQEVAALIDETLSHSVKATGKHEASMRQQLVNKKLENLRRSRGIREHALKRNSVSTTRNTKRGNSSADRRASNRRRERISRKSSITM